MNVDAAEGTDRRSVTVAANRVSLIKKPCVSTQGFLDYFAALRAAMAFFTPSANNCPWSLLSGTLNSGPPSFAEIR